MPSSLVYSLVTFSRMVLTGARERRRNSVDLVKLAEPLIPGNITALRNPAVITLRCRGRSTKLSALMTGLTRILFLPRVLLAAALLMSVNATLVEYACAGTGESATAHSFRVANRVGEAGRDSCEFADGRLHRMLCEDDSAFSSCEARGCSVDLAGEPLTIQAEVPSYRPSLGTIVVTGAVILEKSPSFPQLSRVDRAARSGHLLPIRLRISSLLL